MRAQGGSEKGPLAPLFEARGWHPFAFQEATWRAYLEGANGFVHVPTGAGKTLAAFGGPLIEALGREDAGPGAASPDGVRLIWVTPLRALARDTARQLAEAADAVGLGWRVELRTSDTGAAGRARQRRRPPEVLVTTPESLTLLLAQSDPAPFFGSLDAVVVDEWHELLSTKRGTQTELALARLRHFAPGLRTWGLGATLANLDEALAALVGADASGVLVDGSAGAAEGPLEIVTVLPDEPTRFPWAGHLGLSLVGRVADELAAPGTALLFTNTRSQAELWHRALVELRPEWADDVLLHHGSLDGAERAAVEARIADGSARCVVCTSTLDLGVDFAPVDRVLQVGSPKGIARLLQRAGRSGHHPGGTRRITCVPTHAFELVEFAAAREAVRARRIEPRIPLDAPLDVLAQHMVTVALGGGFRADDLFDEVRTTWAYRSLTRESFGWALDFVVRGGQALTAYPHYHRVEVDAAGVHRVGDRTIARRHRMTIGTITEDAQVVVRFQRGARLGTIEESFLGRLAPGDRFLFAGRELELVRVRDMEAWVRRPRGRRGSTKRGVPRWMGGRLPISTELGETVAAVLAGHAAAEAPERIALTPLLDVQARWSIIPEPGLLLCERHRTREGVHVFFFPFLGRLAHDGLAALVAWRLSQREPATLRVSANDYGFEIASEGALPDDPAVWREVLSPHGLVDDLLDCMNATELARRRFREVARVAGLVFNGYPGRSKTSRQLQASAGLIHDVLARWDPDNLLLAQARREVLEHELELRRLRDGLERMAGLDMVWRTPRALTPLAFPIWAERVEASVSSESWADRVRRMAGQLEAMADASDAPSPAGSAGS